jgi:hypothetical protein
MQDPITQYPGFISYAASNPYHPLVNDSEIRSANKSYTKSGGCEDQVHPSRTFSSNRLLSINECRLRLVITGDLTPYALLRKIIAITIS